MKLRFALVLLALCVALPPLTTLAAEAKRPSQVALKIVHYRDAVSFPIPATWNEDDEPGVQGTYYEDGPGTGTLRVSVMQWSGANEEDRNRRVKALLFPGSVETLKQGVYLKREIHDAEEKGEPLKLHRWLVVLALPENTCRLVVFTHTVTSAQEGDAAIQTELGIVDSAVRSAVYSYKPQLPLVDQP